MRFRILQIFHFSPLPLEASLEHAPKITSSSSLKTSFKVSRFLFICPPLSSCSSSSCSSYSHASPLLLLPWTSPDSFSPEGHEVEAEEEEEEEEEGEEEEEEEEEEEGYHCVFPY